MRYLMGIGDDGKAFELSSDPLLETVRPYVDKIRLGDTVGDDRLHELLSNEKIFGINLYDVGLADRTVVYFNELIAGEEAVRKTLKKYVV